MREVQDWDSYFFDICDVVKKRSKDSSTQVGVVIVGPDNKVRATGYNGPPSGVDDTIPERHERPEKYHWFEHAERNAIYSAASIGTPLADCKMYVPYIPCCECARGIIQSGILMVISKSRILSEYWHESQERGLVMFKESGVEVIIVEKDDAAESV